MKFAYINNEPFEITEGETILSFIRKHKNKNRIPTLCDTPNLDPFGSLEKVATLDGKLKAVLASTSYRLGNFIVLAAKRMRPVIRRHKRHC